MCTCRCTNESAERQACPSPGRRRPRRRALGGSDRAVRRSHPRQSNLRRRRIGVSDDRQTDGGRPGASSGSTTILDVNPSHDVPSRDLGRGDLTSWASGRREPERRSASRVAVRSSRRTSSACAGRRDGSNSTGRPSPGCAKPRRRRAATAGRGRAARPASGRRRRCRSPTQGCRTAAMCTRIWWVRPVSRWMSSSDRGPERLDGLVVGDARLAAGDDGELVVGGRVPVDRRVDGAALGSG